MTRQSDSEPGTEMHLRRRLMMNALENVPFEGWSEAGFRCACERIAADPVEARRECPAGALDLALEFQRWGDELMEKELAETDLNSMRMNERVATAVETRLAVVAEHREAVRRVMTLFALPFNGTRGARSLWRSADRIWNLLGDRADDYNWYTKRAMLSAVIGSSALYWLGDSGNGESTRLFIERRINDVMRVETIKGQIRRMPGGTGGLRFAEGLMRAVRPPTRHREGFPGWMTNGGQS